MRMELLDRWRSMSWLGKENWEPLPFTASDSALWRPLSPWVSLPSPENSISTCVDAAVHHSMHTYCIHCLQRTHRESSSLIEVRSATVE